MKRHAPLERHTPLKTVAPTRRRRARRIDRETPAEKLHKRLVHGMETCAAAKLPGARACSRILVAAHMGRSGGTSRKHGDWTCTALMCASDPRTGQMGHHEQFDQRCGTFAGWNDDQRQDFAAQAVTDARVFVWKQLEGEERHEYEAHLDLVPFFSSATTRRAFEEYMRVVVECPF